MSLHSTDIARFSWGALRGYPSRTLLMLLAMAIGVGAVVILTALGDGARHYVLDEFAGLGTNLVIVFPGRSETTGIDPSAMMGETTRDLTLEDAQSLLRSARVKRIAPINVGQAEISRGSRSREVVTSWSCRRSSARRLSLRTAMAAVADTAATSDGSTAGS